MDTLTEQTTPGAGQPQPADGAEAKPVQLPADGAGPLLERDYWGVIEGTERTPEETMEMVLLDFPRFSPEDLACFSRPDGGDAPLGVDERMDIQLKMAGHCDVRVTHVDERSLTLRTLEGHPEAGRITMGAYRDDDGNLVFRIRSRARAGSLIKYIGYELFGKEMQTQVWTTFIERVAEGVEGRLVDGVHTKSQEVEEKVTDAVVLDVPTFATKPTG
ncbi:MAG TPA: DUF1990 family protein [Armatimonadota bacterium]|nr:DUF1990 family protein [Armatimonadota bacterium]